MSGASRRIGTACAAAAALVGAAGCHGVDKDKAADKPEPKVQSRSAATKVLTAAYEKTSAAKSAKFTMTMSMPASAGNGGGDMELSGVMAWDPVMMDVTMDGPGLDAGPDAPGKARMLWRDNVMYMDMGKTASAMMDGKRWMKLDLAAAAKATGDEQTMKQMTAGLENMNQDPSQQLALLLESPNLKHIGAEKVDGVQAQHYKGKLTVKEMLDANNSADLLSEKEREELLDGVQKAGIKGYDTEVWVNEDKYPVRMDVGIDSPQGTVNMSAHYSDYGAAVDVETPPADDTMDLFKMLEGLKDAGAGAEGSSV